MRSLILFVAMLATLFGCVADARAVPPEDVLVSSTLADVERFKSGVERTMESQAWRMEFHSRDREAEVMRSLRQVFVDGFVPATIQVAPDGNNILISSGACVQCLNFTIMDPGLFGHPTAIGLWSAENRLLAVSPQATYIDGYAPYLIVHELIHVIFTVDGIANLGLTQKWEGGEDSLAVALEGWLINGATDGAYYKQVKRLARQVKAGTRPTQSSSGFVFTPMSPELIVLFKDMGARPTELSMAMFAMRATFDMNIFIGGRMRLEATDLDRLYSLLLQPTNEEVDLMLSTY